MATAVRVFWETVTFVAFLVVVAGLLLWSGSRVERRAADLSAEHGEALRLEGARHEERIASLESSWAEREREQAEAEAIAVFRAFEAGIHSAAAARWGRYLDSAKEALMDQPEVLFVHLATPQGRIITTSDPEMAAAGRLDEHGAWALEREALTTRPGESESTLEIAAPVRDQGRTVAYLWLGYDLGRAMAPGEA